MMFSSHGSSSRHLRDCGAQHTDFAAKDQIGTELSIPFAPPSDAFDLNPVSPFWSRDRHADRRPRLAARARALSALRRRFEAEGFIEVEPAALQISPGNETHLHGFATSLIGPDGAAHAAYLHTSPEFAMKKLLAAGETRIFAASRVFRNRERGALHAPEFTMLEWYRTGEPLEALKRDCADVLALAANAAGAKRLTFRGCEADPFAPPQSVTVREAFLTHSGIDLFNSLPHEGRGEPDREALARQAIASGLRVAADDSWSDIFSRILSERIEPQLGIGRPMFLCEYPASEAALARISPRDSRVAERFELYACGVELANAFSELTDPDEQRRRFDDDMREKARVYGEAYPLDEDFLTALADMPEASGVALGFDRLMMLACGADHIEDVQWAPVFDPRAQFR
jgi:elongation factor P--(R)-beta-lysine ligase